MSAYGLESLGTDPPQAQGIDGALPPLADGRSPGGADSVKGTQRSGPVSDPSQTPPLAVILVPAALALAGIAAGVHFRPRIKKANKT